VVIFENVIPDILTEIDFVRCEAGTLFICKI